MTSISSSMPSHPTSWVDSPLTPYFHGSMSEMLEIFCATGDIFLLEKEDKDLPTLRIIHPGSQEENARVLISILEPLCPTLAKSLIPLIKRQVKQRGEFVTFALLNILSKLLVSKNKSARCSALEVVGQLEEMINKHCTLHDDLLTIRGAKGEVTFRLEPYVFQLLTPSLAEQIKNTSHAVPPEYRSLEAVSPLDGLQVDNEWAVSVVNHAIEMILVNRWNDWREEIKNALFSLDLGSQRQWWLARRTLSKQSKEGLARLNQAVRNVTKTCAQRCFQIKAEEVLKLFLSRETAKQLFKNVFDLHRRESDELVEWAEEVESCQLLKEGTLFKLAFSGYFSKELRDGSSLPFTLALARCHIDVDKELQLLEPSTKEFFNFQLLKIKENGKPHATLSRMRHLTQEQRTELLTWLLDLYEWVCGHPKGNPEIWEPLIALFTSEGDRNAIKKLLGMQVASERKKVTKGSPQALHPQRLKIRYLETLLTAKDVTFAAEVLQKQFTVEELQEHLENIGETFLSLQKSAHPNWPFLFQLALHDTRLHVSLEQIIGAGQMGTLGEDDLLSLLTKPAINEVLQRFSANRLTEQLKACSCQPIADTLIRRWAALRSEKLIAEFLLLHVENMHYQELIAKTLAPSSCTKMIEAMIEQVHEVLPELIPAFHGVLDSMIQDGLQEIEAHPIDTENEKRFKKLEKTLQGYVGEHAEQRRAVCEQMGWAFAITQHRIVATGRPWHKYAWDVQQPFTQSLFNLIFFMPSSLPQGVVGHLLLNDPECVKLKIDFCKSNLKSSHTTDRFNAACHLLMQKSDSFEAFYKMAVDALAKITPDKSAQQSVEMMMRALPQEPSQAGCMLDIYFRWIGLMSHPTNHPISSSSQQGCTHFAKALYRWVLHELEDDLLIKHINGLRESTASKAFSDTKLLDQHLYRAINETLNLCGGPLLRWKLWTAWTEVATLVTGQNRLAHFLLHYLLENQEGMNKLPKNFMEKGINNLIKCDEGVMACEENPSETFQKVWRLQQRFSSCSTLFVNRFIDFINVSDPEEIDDELLEDALRIINANDRAKDVQRCVEAILRKGQTIISSALFNSSQGRIKLLYAFALNTYKKILQFETKLILATAISEKFWASLEEAVKDIEHLHHFFDYYWRLDASVKLDEQQIRTLKASLDTFGQLLSCLGTCLPRLLSKMEASHWTNPQEKVGLLCQRCLELEIGTLAKGGYYPHPLQGYVNETIAEHCRRIRSKPSLGTLHHEANLMMIANNLTISMQAIYDAFPLISVDAFLAEWKKWSVICSEKTSQEKVSIGLITFRFLFGVLDEPLKDALRGEIYQLMQELIDGQSLSEALKQLRCESKRPELRFEGPYYQKFWQGFYQTQLVRFVAKNESGWHFTDSEKEEIRLIARELVSYDADNTGAMSVLFSLLQSQAIEKEKCNGMAHLITAIFLDCSRDESNTKPQYQQFLRAAIFFAKSWIETVECTPQLMRIFASFKGVRNTLLFNYRAFRKHYRMRDVEMENALTCIQNICLANKHLNVR